MMLTYRDAPLRIAYIEDNPDDAQALVDSWRTLPLPRMRNPLDIYPSGEAFFAAHDDRAPDLVVVDLTLPGMQGLEVIRRLRQKDDHLPIIVVTGSDQRTAQQVADLAGADWWAQKPIRALGLLEIIGRLGDEDPAFGFVPDFETEVVRTRGVSVA